jgi:hypothetical protein
MLPPLAASRSMTCCRLNISSCFVRAAARNAASRISSTSAMVGLPGFISLMIIAL